jgi:hypothetical protein
MSRDFQIGFDCPHIIGEERTQLGSDRMTLTTQKPISGMGLLKVVVNDQYEVSPSTGIQSSATLVSGKAEPYLVTPGLTDLVIRTQTRYLALNLPVGYQPASRIASIINDAVFNPDERPYLIASVVSGVLQLAENMSSGPTSQVRVSGNAKDGLGFLNQVGAVGQVVLPSFNLTSVVVESPDGFLDNGYTIQFDRQIRPNYYFSISYTVFWNQCLRCLGTEVENDYRFEEHGLPLMVRDDNLLYQSCLKILLTEIKSNIYAQWYGTNLMRMIGSKINSSVQANIQQDIRKALSNLQNMQNLQSKLQRISPKERLYSVENVGVRQAVNDPTAFLVDLSVMNYSFQPIEITIVYTAPGAYALPGTNRLSLGNPGIVR